MQKIQTKRRSRTLLLAIIILVGLGILLLLTGDWLASAFGEATALFSDTDGLESLVTWLGWMGPPALIGLNILQIVVAPIPAYGLFVVAGILYGPIWGGIYGSIGTLAGATLAMLLTRRFGRPLARRFIGDEGLEKWQRVTLSHSPLLWGALLLAPVGDIPYFLAGLSPVGVPLILALTILTRIPTVFLLSAAASEATTLDGTNLALLISAAILILILLFRRRRQILEHTSRLLQQMAAGDSMETRGP